MAISTCVRFSGGLSPPKSEKENPNPGIEIVQRLQSELPKQGVEVTWVENIEFAHQLNCRVGSRTYEVLVGYDWLSGKWWEIFYKPTLSWLRRLFGQTEEEEMRVLTSAIACAVQQLPGIQEICWYQRFKGTAGPSYSASPEY